MCSVDYKWRKRMCHKWQEELQEQQRQQEQQQQSLEEKKRLQQQQQSQLQLQQQHHALINRNINNFVADPMNLRKLFLTRRKLKLLSLRPDFERLVKACFVRAQYGVGHRVAQILGFGKWRPSSEPTLILRIDNTPRIYQLEQLSNSYYEAAELLHWKYVWQANHFELPTKCFVEQKHKSITDANQPKQPALPHPPAPCGAHRSVMHEYLTVHQQRQQQQQPPLFKWSNMLPPRAPSTPLHTTFNHNLPVAAAAAPAGSRYLVEPLDCYKSYLPPVANVKQPEQLQLQQPSMNLSRQLSSVNSKKKISIAEYRRRYTKKLI